MPAELPLPSMLVPTPAAAPVAYTIAGFPVIVDDRLPPGAITILVAPDVARQFAADFAKPGVPWLPLLQEVLAALRSIRIRAREASDG